MNYFVLLISSLLFGYSFKLKQLTLFSTKVIGVYPVLYWVDGILLAAFLILFVWIGPEKLVVNRMGKSSQKFLRWDIALSLLLLLHFYLPLSIVIQITLLLRIALYLYFYPKGELATYAVALGILFASQVFLNPFCSPLQWGNPTSALALGESALLAPTSSLNHMSFVGAKRLDFSGFDISYWGSLSHSLTSYHSIGFSFFTLLIDAPVVDPESFSRSLLQYFFILSVLSSFGFYLLLRSWRISESVALLGGILYLPTNVYYGTSFVSSFPIHATPILVLPYALLVAGHGMRTLSYQALGLSGIIFSSLFYLGPPHPDSLIYASAFYFFFVSWLCFTENPQQKLKSNMVGAIVAFLALCLGSLAFLGPVIEQFLNNDAKVFGHIGSAPSTGNFRLSLSFALQWIRGAGALLPFFLLLKNLNWKVRKEVSFFVVLLIFFALVILPGTNGILRFAPLHLAQYSRHYCYAAIALLVLALVGIDSMKTKSTVFQKRLAIFSLIISIVSFVSLVFPGYINGNTLVNIPNLQTNLLRYGLPSLVFFVCLHLLRRELALWTCVACAFTAIQCTALYWRTSPLTTKPYSSLSALLTHLKLSEIKDSASKELVLNKVKDFTKKREASLEEAEALRNTIDDANLSDSKPEDDGENWPHDRFYFSPIRYNTAALYSVIPNRYHYIYSLTGESSHFGVLPGGFLLNSLIIVDPRFFVSYPPTQALFFLPGHYFEEVGSYLASTMWALSPQNLLSQRHLFDIAGIDYYTVKKSDTDYLLKLGDFTEIDTHLPKKFRYPLSLFHNEASFGLAYLAKEIRPLVKTENRFKEQTPPFSTVEKKEEYVRLVKEATARLNTLPRFGAYLEKETLTNPQMLEPDANHLAIEKIVGNKAAFEVDCQKPPCELIWNTSYLTGWKAFSDSQSIPITRANYAFMNVEAPQGKHLIWFEHRNVMSVLGPHLSWLSALFFLVLL